MSYFSSFRGYRGKKRLLAPNSKKRGFFSRFRKSYFNRFKSTSSYYSRSYNNRYFNGKFIRGKAYFSSGKKFKYSPYFNSDEYNSWY